MWWLVVMSQLGSALAWSSSSSNSEVPYSVTSISQYPYGIDFDLTYDQSSRDYREDVITKLLAQVRYVSADIFRLRITDINESRWEVTDVLSLTSYYTGSLNYEIAFNEAPFNLMITRNQDKDPIFYLNETFRFDDQDIIITNNFNRSIAFYGIGERVTPQFRLKTGGVYTIFSKDQQSPVDNGQDEADNMYGVHPFYLAIDYLAQKASGGFLLNSNAMDTTINDAGIQFRTIGGIIDFFTFIGPTPEAAIKQYHSIIGITAMVSYWSLGWHQCRWGYKTTTELEWVLNNYTSNDLPLDALWSDIDYMDSYKDFTYDPDSYAGLPEFVETLHGMRKHYVPIVDAGVAQADYFGYNDGTEMNVFLQSPYGDGPFVGNVWPGDAVFIDWSHPNSTEYWESMLTYLRSQILYDGLWLDMNEASNFCDGDCNTFPAFNSYTLPYLPGNVDLNNKAIDLAVTHYNGVSEYDFHSLYGYFESKTSSLYMQKTLGLRPFIISRSTFAGSGKYTQHWLGDNYSEWEFMEYSIIGIYNSQMFGISFVGADICGFNYNTTDELCSRWMQLGTLYPFSRNHNTLEAISQEPYALEETTLTTSRMAIRNRYYLLNYLYTLLFKQSTEGGVWFKPAFFEYPGDEELFEEHVSDNFMLGPSLIVHPVLSPGADSLEAYFPEDVWYDLYSGEIVDLSESQTVALDVALPSLIPVHIRGGSIIPTLDLYDRVANVIDLRASNITLIIALNSTGEAFGRQILDDGKSINSITDALYTELEYGYVPLDLGLNELTIQPVYSGYVLADEFPFVSTLKIFGCSGSPENVTYYDGISKRQLEVKTAFDALLKACEITFLESVPSDLFGVFYISYSYEESLESFLISLDFEATKSE